MTKFNADINNAREGWVQVTISGDNAHLLTEEQIASSLSTLPIAVEGKVEAKVGVLVWRKPLLSNSLSRTNSIAGAYRVWTHHEANGQWFWQLEDGEEHVVGSEAEGKAAAQADYETRILSALISSPGKDGGQLWDDPTLDGTDGAHPAWWRGCDHGYAKGLASVGKDGGQEVEAVAISVEGSPLLEWAVDQWKRQVGGRPLRNVHRRSLDDVWRQVIRWAGGDPDKLVGPPHDELLAMESKR